MKKRSILSAAVAVLLSFSACGLPAPNSSAGSEPAEPETSSAASSLETTPALSSVAEESPEAGSAPETAEPTGAAVRIAALKGPTAMGMVKLMDDGENGQTANQYEFTLAGSPDEIVGRIVQGEFDIAAVPTNLSATLYQKTGGKVRLAALNTMGVLYVVDSGDTVHSIADLKGKTVYATGKGSTPEYALNYVLSANGLTPGTDVTVEYRTEHTELASMLAAGQAEIALLPQPFVTSALMQNDKLRVALDLTGEWDKASGGASGLTMGCVVVQQKFIDEQPEALEAFMREYKASVAYVTDPANLEAAAALIEKADILKAPVAQKALPACNIVFVEGEEMKTTASGFLKILFDADPKSVGGVLPDDGLYYVG